MFTSTVVVRRSLRRALLTVVLQKGEKKSATWIKVFITIIIVIITPCEGPKPG